jgi:mannose-6-phosphate isomerase-like protein (cupin superfamily)
MIIARHASDLVGYRISEGDTNWFACLLDPSDGVGFTLVVEIFSPGGATPPNTHQRATETFLVLRGEGEARLDGTPIALRAGTVLAVPPGTEHVIANTGSGRLYCLTLMVPDEEFAALIRNGTRVPLDAEDLAVLTGAAHA